MRMRSLSAAACHPALLRFAAAPPQSAAHSPMLLDVVAGLVAFSSTAPDPVTPEPVVLPEDPSVDAAADWPPASGADGVRPLERPAFCAATPDATVLADGDEAKAIPQRKLTTTSAVPLRARSVHLGFTGILPMCAGETRAFSGNPGAARGRWRDLGDLARQGRRQSTTGMTPRGGVFVHTKSPPGI